MASQHLQMSEWSTTGTYLSHRQDLPKRTNKNNIVSNDTLTVDVNQHHSTDQKNRRRILSNKLSECCTSLPPFFYGLLLGILAAGLILCIVIALWLTSHKNTLTTAATPLLRWRLTGMTVGGIGSSGLASNQLNAPTDMALDSSNTLYIADCFNYRVQKWSPDAPNGSTAAGQASGTSGSGSAYFRGPIGILVDSNNNIYVSDSTNHRVQFWANGALSGTTIAGTGTSGSSDNQLHTPYFISRDANTNTLYIADYNNNRVMSYASGASNGTLIIGGQGPGSNNTQLNLPIGVYFDSLSNNLFISNSGGHHIVRWTLGASSWTLVAGTPGTFGSSSTLLSYPAGVTLDPIGNLYVADAGNQRIQLFLAGQTTGTTIAGISSSSGSSSVQLSSPYSVRLDSQLNLYVADLSNNQIQKFLRY